MTLGIDVGGTNLVVGLVQDGQIVKRVSAPWFPHEATLDKKPHYFFPQDDQSTQYCCYMNENGEWHDGVWILHTKKFTR